mgnify:CR=1 FL=1
MLLMVSASAATSPLGFDRQLLAQVAVSHRGHDLDDAADLVGEVGGHDVHRVGEVFPRAGDAEHFGLAAQLAFGADLARDARHFGRRMPAAGPPSC